MTRSLIWRLAALALLTVLLLVPTWMVRSTTFERAAYRDEAQADIARSWGGRQALRGPAIVQRYHTVETVKVWDGNLGRYVDEQEERPHLVVVFPDTLVVAGDVRVEQRYRGIHRVPVYTADLRVSASFEVPDVPEGATDLRQVLLLGVDDTRGLRAQPAIRWNDRPLPAEPGTGSALGSGVHALLTSGTGELELQLALGGTGALDVAPVGADTRVDLASNWPHPRFSGGYLPETRRIESDGFSASWRTTRYATTVRESLGQCIEGRQCFVGPLELVTVELTDPVNVYALNDRSTKYALLFIVIVFGVFFVYEVLERLAIHPIQYALVGLGQALFFLLLLSLSEHVPFGFAYLAGAGVCTLLLAFYVSYVLRSLRRAAGFAVLLAAVYGALYVMLLSEDYALLLGSLLLLAVLASAMYLTRNLDWYALERGQPARPVPAGSAG